METTTGRSLTAPPCRPRPDGDLTTYHRASRPGTFTRRGRRSRTTPGPGSTSCPVRSGLASAQDAEQAVGLAVGAGAEPDGAGATGHRVAHHQPPQAVDGQRTPGRAAQD